MHQDVMVNSIEELLKVDVYGITVYFTNIFKYLVYRLMGRTVWPETKAVF